ncbi:MAG TPA: outer membrane protein assembly factor BamA [Xanthobacteraceae bacterium]|nr:outer membrane protein assembly factor BamA [Xanthobacteraceae bacterium]
MRAYCLHGTRWAIFVGLLIIISTARLAFAQTASLVVEGNRRIEADAIRSYFPHELDAAGIDRGIKALYASGLFEDARIDRVGGQLIVRVKEAPVIDRVAFEGNKLIKDKQLSSEIQSKPRGTLLRATVQADTQRILEIYRRSGRFAAKVDPKVIELPNDRVNLVFEIAEGEKATVKEITFSGNHAFSSQRLKQEIKTTETNLLSFLSSTDLYDPDRLEADRDLLRRFYLKRGYADVRVVGATAEFDPARKGFVVSFTIDEGALFRFGAVDVRSTAADVDASGLRTRVMSASGAVYSAGAVEKTVDDMTIALSKRGHPFTAVRPNVDRDEAGHLINVTYVIEDGPRVYIERINVRGNTRTRDYVIRREFEIAEGDAYNRAFIERGKRRLENLDYFKSVTITTEPGSAPDRIVLNVDVTEEQTGIFSISGGYSTVDGLIGEVNVGERNLLGSGRSVKASVTFGQYTQGFDLAVVEPYVLGSRIALGVDVFGKETTVNSNQSYGSAVYGGRISAGMPLTDEVNQQWRYSLYNQNLSLASAMADCSPGNPPPGCYANGEASLPIKQAVLDGSQWVSAVGTTTTYNTLDNNKNPTSGVHAELRQDVAGLGGDVNFFKTTGDVQYYHEVTNDVVGMARLQGGYVTPWGGQSLPFLSGFFGGPQLVRGFAPNGFGPRDLTPGTTMDNVGGSRYWATSAELQAPIPYLPPSFPLKVAVFADAGSLWGYSGQTTFPALGQSLQLGDSNVIRSSVGAGLIWASPLGPLRVDYAFPITKATYDVTQPFRFSAGGFGF